MTSYLIGLCLILANVIVIDYLMYRMYIDYNIIARDAIAYIIDTKNRLNVLETTLQSQIKQLKVKKEK